MIGFLLVAIVMLLVAMAFVLVPLLRQTRVEADAPSDQASNVAIFRAQRGEVEGDFNGGLISAEERDLSLGELSARLASELNPVLSAATPQAETVSRSGSPPWLVVGLLAVLIPVGAVMGYATLGSPTGLRVAEGGRPTAGESPRESGGGAGSSNAPSAGAPDAAMSDKQILAMVDTLAKKMEENPKDAAGWQLLARSQNALGRFAEAGKAFERAAALLPNDAQILADYADASVMAQDGKFQGKPYDLIQKSLKLDPNNLKALALAGTAEMRMGNQAASLKHWEKIKSIVPKDSEDSREVDQIIAEVKGGTPVAAPAAVAAGVPVVTPSATSASTPAANPAQAVSGKVTIAADVASKVSANDTLFVFARAVNGPKMPLAVLRVPAPQSWPFTFSLDDSMAMAPGMKLSAFPEVTIEARISKAGNAMPQPGDLAGQSAVVKPGTANVDVSIARVLP